MLVYIVIFLNLWNCLFCGESPARDLPKKTHYVGIISSPQANHEWVHPILNGVPYSVTKWVEQTGAHPLLMPHNLDDAAIEDFLGKLSGLVIPPHHSYIRKKIDASLTLHSENVKKIIMKAIAMMGAPGGTQIPIIGIQQGMASLLYAFAQDTKLNLKHMTFMAQKNCSVDFYMPAVYKSNFFADVKLRFMTNIYYYFGNSYFCQGNLVSKDDFESFMNTNNWMPGKFSPLVNIRIGGEAKNRLAGGTVRIFLV
jgi:hypothetical protein